MASSAWLSNHKKGVIFCIRCYSFTLAWYETREMNGPQLPLIFKPEIFLIMESSIEFG
jgi:hypothetical protein